MKKLIDPFKVISEKKSEFVIWAIFTIVTGQIGIVANFIVRTYTSDTSVISSIYKDSINGSFYTFSIALVASMLGPIFILLINNDRLQFRTIKVFTIISAILFLFVTGTIYASVQANVSVSEDIVNYKVDYTQLIIYFFAIILASYGYCILRLEDSSINFDSINDPPYNEIDDKKVEETIVEGAMIGNDNKGNKL